MAETSRERRFWMFAPAGGGGREAPFLNTRGCDLSAFRIKFGIRVQFGSRV